MRKESIQTFTVYCDTTKYALVNYKEIIEWYQLPFWKKWFTKKPIKEFVKINNERNNY